MQPRRRPSERRFGGWETRGWPRRKRIEEIRAGPSAAAHGGRAEIVGTKRSHRGAAHGGGGTEAAQVRAPRDGLFGPFAFVAPIASYGGWAVPLFLLGHLSRCDVCSPCPPVVWSLLDFESWFPLVQVGDASVLSRGRSFFPAVDDLAATQTTIGARMRSNRWNRGGAPRLVAGREELGDLASLFCCLLSPTCRLHADHTVTLGALNVFFFFCAPVEGRHQLAATRFAFMSPLPA